ncbi:hypothetical protein RB195_023454 [Necator americanus]|uniref:Uncharacterized protein n=1 Tax=Necator americanus TaxID=51031 RepID=A0ABR1EJ91_NECAM
MASMIRLEDVADDEAVCSHKLLAGPTCGIQGCHESVLAQQKQEVHPLNPPASLGKHKVTFGPGLAPYPQLGTRHVASRLTGCDPSSEGYVDIRGSPS